jgi:hypothetical protein
VIIRGGSGVRSAPMQTIVTMLTWEAKLDRGPKLS